MTRYFPKLVALFRLYLSDVFAYKAAAFIWVVADLGLALMMPLVWRAAGGIRGYTIDEVTSYYIATMTISQFVSCHLLWDIGFDIREGVFSSLLLRPFSHMSSSFARNMAWRVGKLALFLPCLLVLVPLYGFPGYGSLNLSWEFFVSLALGQTISFFAAYSVAMVALWTTEFVSLFQLYYFPELLFSGRVVPLSALPDWTQNVSQFLHFRYTVSFPTEVLLGRLTSSQTLYGIGLQVGWIVVLAVLARILFLRGVKQYSGFGA